MRYTKYKTRAKIVLTGDDDLYSNNSGSTYKTTGSSYTNGKTIRFNLNGAFNDVKLSHNCRCIMEACYMPAVTGIANYILVRLGTSTNDKALDTKSFTRGNPVIAVFKGTDTTILNCSEFFYHINVPSNIFSNGYIDFEIECPFATVNIDFFSASQFKTFFINLIVVDEDAELTKDLTLAPPIDYNNYNINIPIRPY